MRYLVTGGAGFIGTHLVGALVARGESVRVLDNFSTGRSSNLAHVLGRDVEAPSAGGRAQTDGVELVNGDIRDAAACREACAGVTVVFHQAAMRAVPRSVDDPMGATEANVIGTLNMLMAAADAGVQRFVNA
ncbi:MAG: NAD-dependent epimerase/dehydratase family protein, partial [Armatimonadota bacterium]